MGYEDFVNLDVDDAVEPQVLPEGTVATLEIERADFNEEKYYLRMSVRPLSTEDGIDCDFASTFSHFLFFPKPEDDRTKVNNKKLALKAFLKAVDLDRLPADPEELVGKTFTAVLKVETSEQYGDQNSVGGRNSYR